MREKFECKRENLTIRGYVWGGMAGKKPAVVLSHGFLGNWKNCKTYAEELEKLGYVCFAYDFCGGGVKCSSDGEQKDMTVRTEVKDLLAVVDYVKGRRDVDENRVTLLGCSQGGYVSAMTAAENPGLAEKLVLFYPALCIPDDARAGHMMFYKFDPKNIPDILGRFPMKLGGDYARTVVDKDPFEQITGYEGPVLLLHGTKDKIVDLSYSRRAAKCYPNCRFEIIKDGTHGFKRKYDVEACRILCEFMKY